MHWKTMAVEFGSERVNRTRQFFCFRWYLKFDKCDERRNAELILSNLGTPTIALDAPTQEQVVKWVIVVLMEAILATTTQGTFCKRR